MLVAASAFGVPLFRGRDAEAAPTPTDYKALICVFLFGGSDCANTVIPIGAAEHAEYYRLRGGNSGIGVPLDRLADSTLNTALALNPGLRKTSALFRAGKAAVVANVGPLLEPTKLVGGNLVATAEPTRAALLPQRLRSHNDQQATWQSFQPETAGSAGWGGRLGDEFRVANGANKIFSSVSTFGANAWGGGVQTTGYQISPPSGALPIQSLYADQLFGSTEAAAAARHLLTAQAADDLFPNELNKVRARSIRAESVLTSALASTSVGIFPASGLGAQLALVSRAIQAGKALGLKRQVFLVGMGGYDHHDHLYGLDGTSPIEGTHEYLLGQVDDALDAIYSESARLGLDDAITTFTMSDFGRTLTSNGDGSDHGWGSHHFVVGGAVKGNAVYGTMPEIAADDPSFLPRGVLLPSTAVDQYANTLARWFGVPQAAMARVVPNIAAFTGALGTPPNLGFMQLG